MFDKNNLALLAKVAFHFLFRNIPWQSAYLDPVHIPVLPAVITWATWVTVVT